MTSQTGSRQTRSVNIVASHVAPRLGIEKALMELRQLLSETGWETKLICLGGDARDSAVAPDAIVCGPPLRGAARFNLLRVVKARAQVIKGAPTILVGLWAALPYLFLGRGRGPVIVWEHSLMRQQLTTNRSLRMLAPIAAVLYRRADVVVAVSEPLADDLRSMLRLSRVSVIPNVVDSAPTPANPAEAGDSPPGKRLFMAGSLSATKNQRLAIEALALLSDPDTKLVIAGDGATRRDLEDLAAARGVRSQVDFLGHVSPARVAAEFARADLFIHTAVGETFGYVYFEAASAGVPVVAVRNPVAEQLVPEFIPGRITSSNPQAIAQTIRRSLDEDPSETEVSTAHGKRQMKIGRAATAVAWHEAVGDA